MHFACCDWNRKYDYIINVILKKKNGNSYNESGVYFTTFFLQHMAFLLKIRFGLVSDE